MYTKYLQAPCTLLPLLARPSSLLPSLSPRRRPPPAAAAYHLAVPRMWGSTDGGTPEVTLETSMGAITVEVPSHSTYIVRGLPWRWAKGINNL